MAGLEGSSSKSAKAVWPNSRGTRPWLTGWPKVLGFPDVRSPEWPGSTNGAYLVCRASCSASLALFMSLLSPDISARVWRPGNSFAKGKDCSGKWQRLQIVEKYEKIQHCYWVGGVRAFPSRQEHIRQLIHVFFTRQYLGHSRALTKVFLS